MFTVDVKQQINNLFQQSEFEMRSFYPGQELCGTHEDYEGAKWLHTTQMRGPDSLGAKPLYTVPVIVEKVGNYCNESDYWNGGFMSKHYRLYYSY